MKRHAMRPQQPRKSQKRSQSGVALFMVISAVGLLAILLSELTYSTQMSSRMAYNYVDNLKAYYLAKAALKLSMLRLKAYKSIKGFIDDPNNKQVAGALPADLVDKVWNFPFVYPIPVRKEATMTETDAIKKFAKEAKLSGSFTAGITGMSTKLNLNNLLLKQTDTPPSGQPNQPASNQGGRPAPEQPKEMNFREVLEPAITSVIEKKKDEDKEFASTYRNVTGKDIIDAIMCYLVKDSPPSNLPGFKPIKAKDAPFYSLSELHLVPGIDDELYNLIEPLVTVYTTPGINVNAINKKALWGLFPNMTEDDVDSLLRKRDDPQVGEKFKDEAAFWDAVQATSAGKSIQDIKDRFARANLKIKTTEESFKVGVQAVVGFSTRRLEAYVTFDNTQAAKKDDKQQQGQNAPMPATPTPTPGLPPTPKDDTSAKKPTGLNLIYWRMI